ncbi:hypothetical protein F8388_013764 [Cannabis sativa]|uniref:Uncharacterized protein n=1 Tax=Cannabis sativa TaxID=3483 RepID=A0A7J6F1Z8_CANSA|nr:hypothetical protein F8388_013764 [Cannabis sativa]
MDVPLSGYCGSVLFSNLSVVGVVMVVDGGYGNVLFYNRCTQCGRACPTDVLEMIPWDGCKAKQIASALDLVLSFVVQQVPLNNNANPTPPHTLFLIPRNPASTLAPWQDQNLLVEIELLCSYTSTPIFHHMRSTVDEIVGIRSPFLHLQSKTHLFIKLSIQWKQKLAVLNGLVVLTYHFIFQTFSQPDSHYHNSPDDSHCHINMNDYTYFILYLWDSSIDIITLWMVNDDPRPWIEFTLGNIIIHEHHYVLLFQPTFYKQLIGVAHISLDVNKQTKTKRLKTRD